MACCVNTWLSLLVVCGDTTPAAGPCCSDRGKRPARISSHSNGCCIVCLLVPGLLQLWFVLTCLRLLSLFVLTIVRASFLSGLAPVHSQVAR